MSTLRDFVSRVRSTHRLLSSDDSINDRTIAREGKNNSFVLINQKLNQRRFWNTDTIFTPIPCLEMKNVPLAECCDYVADRKISRSKLKIPRISEGNYQYAIQLVSNIETGRTFKYCPPNRYVNLLKLGLKKQEVYYWIHNDYLYMSQEDIQVAKIVAFFEEDLSDEILYPDCKCTDRAVKDYCRNPLDLEFKCPGVLESAVVTMTSKSLLETYFRLPEDKTSDQKDDTTVNKT